MRHRDLKTSAHSSPLRVVLLQSSVPQNDVALGSARRDGKTLELLLSNNQRMVDEMGLYLDDSLDNSLF